AMTGPNQLDRIPAQIPGRDEMLELHTGPRTEAGARENIRVAVKYVAAWLSGRGAVPLYDLMEDAATAEICRAQLWQWLRFEAQFDDARRFSHDLFEDMLAEELAALGDIPNLKPAARLLHELVTADEFDEFLTLPAYELLG
ncbi:MAG: malate synthase A, partial [Sphingomicrobium sp.]